MLQVVSPLLEPQPIGYHTGGQEEEEESGFGTLGSENNSIRTAGGKPGCLRKSRKKEGSSGRGITGGEAVQSSSRRVYARRRMADSNLPDPH
eukprot:1159184-Pelagomonas_calceolata.AAC.14